MNSSAPVTSVMIRPNGRPNAPNIVKKLFHLILFGDLVSVFLADELNIDPYDIAKIEKEIKKIEDKESKS